MKIWAKLIKGDKIIADTMLETERGMRPAEFIKTLQEISYTLDISTPVSLATHRNHFDKFNHVVYLPRDFVEDVDFDKLVLERVKERKKTNNYYI